MGTRDVTTTDTTRADWLAWRRSGIGASDIAGILGISPWASPFSVWVDKLGLLPDEELDDDDPREFGRRAEAMLGPWFRDRTGLELADEQMWLTSKDEPWMLATPDAVVCEPGGGTTLVDSTGGDRPALGPLEIKTDFGKPWAEIPAHYQAQGQWQMAVGGWDRMWFAVLHGRRFRVYELARDQADIDMMTSRAGAFWADHVLAQVPPPIDSSDATDRTLKLLYPEADREAVELDAMGHLALLQMREFKAQGKEIEAGIKRCTSQLRAQMAGAEVGLIDGQAAVTLRTQTRKTTCEHCGAVDESAPFRVLRPSKEFT
jgi:putative phage-type endonuclease